VTRAGERDRLERLCRYALRPPLAEDRLQVEGDGVEWLTLRHRWADGTTPLKFEPLELLERLAVLTPRPRINLVLYYGVLAPRAVWRAAIVASSAGETQGGTPQTAPRPDVARDDGSAPRRPGAYLRAELMRRTFDVDVLACPHCGGRLRLLALIEQARTVERILRHLGLPTEVPAPAPARAPPRQPHGADGACEDPFAGLDTTF
jgi:Putative transposase